MAMSAPPVIVGLIGGDAQQPGTKRWPTAKHLDRAKGSKKGFLRDISSDFAVAEYAQDNIIHSLLIMQHQLIEGGDVSVLAARNEQGLIFSRRLCHCAASLFLQFAQVYHSCEYPEKPPVSSWGAGSYQWRVGEPEASPLRLALPYEAACRASPLRLASDSFYMGLPFIPLPLIIRPTKLRSPTKRHRMPRN